MTVGILVKGLLLVLYYDESIAQEVWVRDTWVTETTPDFHKHDSALTTYIKALFGCENSGTFSIDLSAFKYCTTQSFGGFNFNLPNFPQIYMQCNSSVCQYIISQIHTSSRIAKICIIR